MEILVLKSSGNKNGSSALIAGEFINGAKEAGHVITEYDLMNKDIRPCRGCNACGMNGACVQKDDFENELKNLIKKADMLVFVMPVYYYNWPAQLKCVVDRFYSFTGELTGMHKKTALLAVAWDDSDTVFEVTEAYYRRICEYMQFTNCGTVFGKGCGTPSMTAESIYPKAAYELGLKIV